MDPYVVHLRKALNNYYDGSTQGIEDSAVDFEGEGLAHFDKAYYKSPFVLFSYAQHMGGGRTIVIVFSEKPDRLFRAWMYLTGDQDYLLRGFESEPMSPENLRLVVGNLKLVLANPALAL